LPKLLIITNEGFSHHAKGQIDGYQLLVDSGEIESVVTVGLKPGYDSLNPFERVKRALMVNAFDAVLIWTPFDFPNKREQFNELLSLIGNRPIYYWEGDPWLPPGKAKKSVTPQMGWWMSVSEIVFSVVINPHFDIFMDLGARKIQHMPLP
jgi:hypothetical protein